MSVDFNMNRGIEMKTLNNERGAVLITTLLLLVIITLIGLIAINTATVDIQISGQTKRSSRAFGGAEAGIDLATPVIEATLEQLILTPASIAGAVYSADILNASEILNDQLAAELATFNADITFANIGQGVQVSIDIDRLNSVTIPGGAIEFAAGYEGVGSGAAGGGTGVLLQVTSQASVP